MLKIQTQIPLAQHTTLKIGGKAAEFVSASSEAEIISALDYNDSILILGGGSNLLISDSGFAGRVIQINTSGKKISDNLIEVAAGENWDEFVNWGLVQGFGQFAPLTGIPGTVGATPIQNVGAYGTEVSELIHSVEVFDRSSKFKTILSNQDCKFSYRSSIFKEEKTRYVVLNVRFNLVRTNQVLVKYDELAGKLQCEIGESVDANLVLQAVRDLRASKGMLLDSADRDTFSVGSFFLNPRVSDEHRNKLLAAPAWLQPDGSWKISAAWLIAQAGFERGYQVGDAAISSKHTLALCNLGNATCDQVIKLATQIEEKVSNQFGIQLLKEPTYVF
jgi:UDP-N-acetylmuramate dehydrogenase